MVSMGGRTVWKRVQARKPEKLFRKGTATALLQLFRAQPEFRNRTLGSPS